MLANQKIYKITGGMKLMPEEKNIIEKITELLYKEQLITWEEKSKVAQLMQEEAIQ